MLFLLKIQCKCFFSLIATGGYRPPPLKTRFFEGSASLDHAVADFRKKVRFSPPANGPGGKYIFRHPPWGVIGGRMVQIGRKTHFFFENRRQQGLERRYLPEKLVKKGVPLFWALFGNFGDFR